MKKENIAKHIQDTISAYGISLSDLISENYKRFSNGQCISSDERYLKCFTKLELDFDREYSAHEKAISSVIGRFPRNDVIEDVLAKVVIINSLYSAGLYTFGTGDYISVTKMADHIIQLEKDEALTQLIEAGCLNVVDMIGTIGENHATSFASKYCSWHNQEAFPIYDSKARGFIYYWYKSSDDPIRYTQDELRKYACYSEAVKQFRKDNCEGVSYKQLDIFMWLYAKKNRIAIA